MVICCVSPAEEARDTKLHYIGAVYKNDNLVKMLFHMLKKLFLVFYQFKIVGVRIAVDTRSWTVGHFSARSAEYDNCGIAICLIRFHIIFKKRS